VARRASAVLVAALLIGTLVAFVATERLKLQKSPITSTAVTKVFSPVCECDSDVASIFFRLRKAETMTVSIIDGDGRVVRVLVEDSRRPRGPVELLWNGRDDANAIVPEGFYRPRVRLARQHRTIVLPNPIQVDTTAPTATIRSVVPRTFSPDGDGRRDRVRVRYALSESARAILLVDGARHTLTRSKQRDGVLVWNGRVDGRSARRGVHVLRVAGRDAAGNVGRPSRVVPVVLRYVALGRSRIEAVAGTRFAVLVSADATTVRWRLAGKTGLARPGTLRLRAPDVPGSYVLTVRAGDHAARAVVIATEPQ
jgi:hypothetical protein